MTTACREVKERKKNNEMLELERGGVGQRQGALLMS